MLPKQYGLSLFNLLLGVKMKNGNTFYMELSRSLFTDEYKDLSQNTKWLFVVLNELEQRYCSSTSRDYFIRSDEELAKDSQMSIATLKRAKSELSKTNLIKIGYVHWIVDKTTNKKSEKRCTSYSILK